MLSIDATSLFERTKLVPICESIGAYTTENTKLQDSEWKKKTSRKKSWKNCLENNLKSEEVHKQPLRICEKKCFQKFWKILQPIQTETHKHIIAFYNLSKLKHRTVRGEPSCLLDAPNSLHPNLQFTLEKTNSEGNLPFLDLNINVSQGRRVTCRWYQKPTDTGTILNYRSCAPTQCKRSVIQGTVHRVFRSTSSWEQFDKAMETNGGYGG